MRPTLLRLVHNQWREKGDCKQSTLVESHKLIQHLTSYNYNGTMGEEGNRMGVMGI